MRILSWGPKGAWCPGLALGSRVDQPWLAGRRPTAPGLASLMASMFSGASVRCPPKGLADEQVIGRSRECGASRGSSGVGRMQQAAVDAFEMQVEFADWLNARMASS